MKKILFIDNTKIFTQWASKTYEYKINNIKKDNRFEYLDIENISKNPNIDNYDTVIFGWNATYISKYYTTMRDFYLKKIPKLETKIRVRTRLKKFFEIKNTYLIVQDFNCPHDYDNSLVGLVQYLKQHKIKGIITPYSHTEGTNFIKENIPNLKIIHIPHHIDSNYFKDWENKKVNDIFIFGNINKTIYPFRHRLDKLLKNNKDKFNLVHWDGIRNYFKFNQKKSNDNLSKIINQSWLTICTSSKFNLLLGKYFETSMSNSVVCGNMATDGFKIWDNNYIELLPEMSDDEIIDILLKALNNKQKLKSIMENMNNKIKNFSLNNFTNELVINVTES